ncbi:hypothetical protein U2P60_04085 [Brucella sp. H1_1004]|uniref:hypothetical protein n=1 Tax=Brucella sp. H1_1004 TaxID=3110109 RepID=UPI0039B3EF16
MVSETLFAHLATRFSQSPENIAIEALGFVLQKSAAARAAFTAVASAGGFALPEDLSFATQAVAEDDGRPDLEGYGSDLLRYVVAETKFHAGLTQHQPLTYAARLPADVPASLIFIIPSARMTSLWQELTRRLKGGNYAVSARRELKPELWQASIDEKNNFVLVSWRALLSAVLREMEIRDETERLDDVRQLVGLCERMDTEAFLPLRSEELTSIETARRYVQYGQIVNDVGEALSSLNGFDHKGLTSSSGLGYSGRYIRGYGIVCFIAFDCIAWASHKLSPVWLRFDRFTPPETLDCLRRGSDFPDDIQIIVESPKRVFIPLIIEPGMERPEIVRSLAGQVERVMLALSAPQHSAVNFEASGGLLA